MKGKKGQGKKDAIAWLQGKGLGALATALETGKAVKVQDKKTTNKKG